MNEDWLILTLPAPIQGEQKNELEFFISHLLWCLKSFKKFLKAPIKHFESKQRTAEIEI